MIDIGGGSTELVVGARGEVDFHVSTQIGVVRHSERHLHADPPTAAELGALAGAADRARGGRARAEVRARVSGGGRGRRHRDPVRRRSTSARALRPCDGSRATCCPPSASRRLLERLAALPLAERREMPGLDPDRRPTIVAGVVVLCEVLAAFGLDEVEVSERDILWGVRLRQRRSTTSN